MPIRQQVRITSQWLKNKLSSCGIILIYHRVTKLKSDPQLLCVTPENFAEQLEILNKNFHPISLRDLAKAIVEGNIKHRSVAVTFDDGYADNFYYAAPLLKQYNIPATVFVTSGYVGEKREFWWDELERLLLQPGMLPKTLSININGNAHTWDLGDSSDYSEKAFELFSRWNVLDNDDPSMRHHLYRSLHSLLRPLSETERSKVLDELLAWCGAQSMARQTHRVLLPDEMISLAEDGLVEIGCHTHTHQRLATLTLDTQREEIENSKFSLEEIIDRPIESFSYPYGTKSDYTTDSTDIVREVGFSSSCSNFPGTVWRRSDRFQLPRILIRDWNGAEFENIVENFFN